MSDTRQEFLTVEQTAAVCGIGRTSAYQLARRAADHGDGDFPAVRFGKQLRIPRRKLEDLIGGPITLPTDPPTEPDPTTTPPTTTSNNDHHRTTTPNNNNTTTTTHPHQPQLPLTTP
ncbi:helix-turn-helix transcriptional regulator [Ilumatobacter sp.]|uniref:helix-turn-helix transcriptional regulator n=1 Tax=Ilumatobacter sp. TaxID=1967498 RepID=UPI003B51E0F4